MLFGNRAGPLRQKVSHISMIALGVRNLPRSVRFYRDGLGFSPSSADIGSHFAIREGGRTVGSGVITEVVD